MNVFGNVFGDVHNGSVLNLYDPAKDTDLVFRSAARSGLTFPDLIGANTPDILVPVASFTGSNNIGRAVKITGGQAWDFTIRFKLTDASANNPLLSCGGYSGGAKGLMIRGLGNVLYVFTSNGTGSVSSSFDFTLVNNTWHTLRVQWSGATGATITLTLDGVVKTRTTCNGWVGDSTDNISYGSYSVIKMTGKISSVIGILGSLTTSLYPTGLNTIEFDVTGLSYSWSGTKASVYEIGETWFLDKGFVVYKDAGNNYVYINNKSDGTIISDTTIRTVLGGTYVFYQSVLGSLTGHNLWESKVRFKNDFFDRSNTTIWGDLARGADYDSGNVKDFLISKLDLLTLRTWLNDGYRGMLYLKGDLPTVDDMTVLSEIFLKTTDTQTTIEQSILTYTLDIRRTQKDENGAFILDADGYKQLYLYGDLGGNAVANVTKFQAQIDAGASATLSGNKYEVYAISHPLVMAANKSLTVNCELRPKKATIVNLTANVAIGDTVINVDSVVGFNVGEWVAISDNLLAVQAGAGTQTRRVASCGKITEIGATTITINQPSRFAVTAASGGKLGHNQSVIICNDASNVTINGGGIINGDWTNQYDTEPVRSSTFGEEILMGNGIVIYDSHSVIVSDTLEIKNCDLHGIAVRGLSETDKALSNSVTGANLHHNHDKNLLALNTTGLILNGCNADYSLFEDGFSFYSGNTNFQVLNCSASGNNRSNLQFTSNQNANGLVDTFTNHNGSIQNYSSGMTLTDITMTGTGYLMNSDLTGNGDDNIYNNLSLNIVSGSSLVQILGGCTGIAFNTLILDGCTSSTAAILVDDRSGNAAFPTVAITGGGISNHTGTKTSIDASATVTFTDFTGLP